MLYTVREVSKLLKTSVQYVYRLINAGLLSSIRVGGIKVSQNALDQFLSAYEGQDVNRVLTEAENNRTQSKIG